MRPDRYAARDINARDPSTAVFNDPKTTAKELGNMANVTSNCSVIHFVSCFIASFLGLAFFFYLSFYSRPSFFIFFLLRAMCTRFRFVSCSEDVILLFLFLILS